MIARHARINPLEYAEECEPVGAFKPPALHLLIKSTHNSPITPARPYLQSQGVYRSDNTAAGVCSGGGKDQSHEMRE